MDFPNYFNTLITIVTYNPKDDFGGKILRYIRIVDKIVIVDNASNNDISKYIPKEFVSHFVIIKSSTNRGVAWGLNQGILYAQTHDYLYVLTFDQDSLPVNEILQLYSGLFSKVHNIGLLGTTFSDHKISSPPSISFSENATLITSGTLHPISIFDDIGLYDEGLFIDSVDFDFVLRVKKKFRVLRINEPLICHELGTPFSRFGIESSNHNIVRRYYMARNHIIICKRYWKIFPTWIFKKNVFFLIAILKMLIVEENAKEKFISTIRGIRDALILNK